MKPKNFNIKIRFKSKSDGLGSRCERPKSGNTHVVYVDLPDLADNTQDTLSVVLHEISHAVAREFGLHNSRYRADNEREAWALAKLMFENIAKDSLATYEKVEAKKVLGYDKDTVIGLPPALHRQVAQLSGVWGVDLGVDTGDKLT